LKKIYQILHVEVKKMINNGMGHMGLNYNKFVDTPNKCMNELCGTTLKNKKKYVMSRVVERKSGYWSIGKICKKCKHESLSSMGMD